MAGTDHRHQGAGLTDGGPVVILVEPQLGENIGASARAMLNCGLAQMRIVAPRDGWPNPAALTNASGADGVIEAATVFDSTAAAIADLQHLYATTARPRHMVKPVLTPAEAARQIRIQGGGGGRVGILFGGERAGLTNDDVSLADTIITAPLNPGFTSLNLAQAVLLVAWEWWQAADATPPRQIDTGASRIAHRDELLNVFAHLETELDRAAFFSSPGKRPSMIRNLRNMFERADLTEQEVRTLHGIVTALSGMRRDGKPRGTRDSGGETAD